MKRATRQHPVTGPAEAPPERAAALAADHAGDQAAAAFAPALDPALEALEIDLLLEALLQRHGYDFRGYERTGLRRKLHALMEQRGLATVSALQERVLHEPHSGAALLRALSVAPATLFDDARHWSGLRQALEALRGSALPKVWLAECAGPEEAWSLAILLAEQQPHNRAEIHATLANQQQVDEAADAGLAGLPLARLAACEEHYRRCGGAASLADYFAIGAERAVLLPQLRARISWAQYNLVTDASFNEFQLIVCRGALADYGPPLRQRALRLFHDSLAMFGTLGLDRPLAVGDPLAARYRQLYPAQSWYKRIA